MPRKPRAEEANAVWHVTARGTARAPIFQHPSDYQLFLALFAQVATLYEWKVFVFTLMTNHLHLILQTCDPNLGVGMHNLLGRFASAFNKQYGRVGHLFQDRFKSQRILTESHLLEATRYVLLNPVRVGMVNDFRDYRWNSYKMMCSDMPPTWFDWTPVLSYLQRNEPFAAREQFWQFVDDGVAEPKPQVLCA
jgi:REP element-mobilizing transposase RayT